MAETNNVNNSQLNQEAIQIEMGDSALAGSGGVANAKQASLMTSSSVSSLDQLKKLSPQLYNQIIISIMDNMMIQMQRQEKDLEAAMAKLDPANQ